MRPYIRLLRFSVEPHPLAQSVYPLLQSVGPIHPCHPCYNGSMDANRHSQPISHAYPDPPHQGVLIEDYRGPLLSKPQADSRAISPYVSSYPTPLFAWDRLPQQWVEPPPRPHWFLRRWLVRMFRSTTDETLNSARRGLGWMLVALLGCCLISGTTVIYQFPLQFVTAPLYLLAPCIAPLAILIFLPAALLDSTSGLRDAHFSLYPRLVRRISILSLLIELMMVFVIVYTFIWVIVQLQASNYLPVQAQVLPLR